MRISAGKFKGREIDAPRGLLSRPPLAIAREAVFDIIGRNVEGKRVLDLFAGSGSLGFEALSRGAKYVQFVDNSRRCVEMIRHNAEILNVMPDVSISRDDAIQFVKDWQAEPFEIVFVDPPFLSGKAAQVLDTLEHSKVICGDSIIVERFHWREEFPIPESFTTYRKRKFGESIVLFLMPSQAGGTF